MGYIENGTAVIISSIIEFCVYFNLISLWNFNIKISK